MRDSELAADVAGPHSLVSKVNYSLSDHIGERAAIDKETPELVNTAVTWKKLTINHWLILSIELILTL